MAYNSWKMMDKLSVAVRTGEDSYRGFTGYIVDHGDEEALKKAKDWARTQTWDSVQRKHIATHEPDVHHFDNEGFTARIVESAGGSSQGGRLSFWAVEIEKDGVKFTIGVNDAVLADLIRSSTIVNGEVKEKVMFARRAGQPGLIHEGMESYKEAVSDMQHKADMKSMKKTKKWEAGGIYQSITQTSICLGEVWDHYEEKVIQTNHSWYGRKETTLVKREKPIKVLAWVHVYRFEDGLPKDFSEVVKKELADRRYVYFHIGSPPARAKTGQLKIKEADMKELDKIYALREDQAEYGSEKIKGRIKRVK